MKRFTKTISPSMIFKILVLQYEMLVKKLPLFHGKESEIDIFLSKLQMCYHVPETKIFKQKNKSFRNALILASG